MFLILVGSLEQFILWHQSGYDEVVYLFDNLERINHKRGKDLRLIFE